MRSNTTNSILARFVCDKSGALDYPGIDLNLAPDPQSRLGETARVTAVSSVIHRIVEISSVYNEHPFDFIRILEFVNDAINCLENTDPQSPLDITVNQQNPYHLRYKENIRDITWWDGKQEDHRHEKFKTVSNPNIISLLYFGCVDKECGNTEDLNIMRYVTPAGKMLDKKLGKEVLQKPALLEIKQIIQDLIAEAIQVVEMRYVGNNDRNSEQYQEALRQYPYFHTYPGDRHIQALAASSEIKPPSPLTSPRSSRSSYNDSEKDNVVTKLNSATQDNVK